AAFTEYTSKKVKKAEKTERPSVLAKLSQFKEMVKNAVVDHTKRKELER
ncbi:PcfB family protein, partial [Enterocloster bolteae]